jgi:uncharacterized membrane protein YphA (DoxX/SURF4 family)
MLEQTRVMAARPISGRISLAKINIGQPAAIGLLRISLAGVFFWFGILKVTGSSPVVEMFKNSLAFLGLPPYLQLLGMGEIGISLGLLVPRFSRFAAALMVVHLLCTLSLVFISPSLVFAPSFPVLTMDGEFLAKNLVLISAGLTVIVKKT